MTTDADIQLTLHNVAKLPIPKAEMEEFMYGHLSQCILSAVYSLGATATAELNVVRAYTQWAGLSPASRSGRQVWLAEEQQEPLDWFVEHIESMGADIFASQVVHNRQPTAPVGGILKAECCLAFAKVCVAYEVQYFQDLPTVVGLQEFERDVRRINGLRSGKGLHYFYMLAGEEQYVKADRHVERFLTEVVGRPLSTSEMQELISTISIELQLSPRVIDNMIWEYQRALTRGGS